MTNPTAPPAPGTPSPPEHGTVLANPKMKATYEGIDVSFYGDANDLIALGWHTKHLIASVYRQHHEELCGELTGWTNAQMADQVTHRWVIFTHDTEEDGWVFDNAAPHQPGALQVTFLAIG